jgi:hypothetical protein
LVVLAEAAGWLTAQVAPEHQDKVMLVALELMLLMAIAAVVVVREWLRQMQQQVGQVLVVQGFLATLLGHGFFMVVAAAAVLIWAQTALVG